MTRRLIPLYAGTILLAIAVPFIFQACTNDSKITDPGPTGTGANLGSGTVSVQLAGASVPSLAFSGQGTWPPRGTGVAAVTNTGARKIQIVGYKQTFPSTFPKEAGTIGARFSFVFISLSDTGTIRQGKTYHDAGIMIGIDIDTSKTDSLAYEGISDTVVVVSKSNDSISLRFSGIARRPSDGSTITLTNGQLSAKLVNGALDLNGGGSTGTRDFLGYHLPDVGNVGGILGAVRLTQILPSPLPPLEVSAGFGGFFQLSSASLLSYAGSLTVNGTVIDTIHTEQGPAYVGSGVPLVFDGIKKSVFVVAGATPVPAFADSITNPTVSLITAPPPNMSISRSANLTVSWSNSGLPSDSVLITISNLSGGSTVFFPGLTNGGTYSVPTASLSSLGTGTTILTVTKFRYRIRNVSGVNYALISQSVCSVQITLTD